MRYDRHQSYVISLMDTEFIPVSGADIDTFINVVDEDVLFFYLHIMNSVGDDTDNNECLTMHNILVWGWGYH